MVLRCFCRGYFSFSRSRIFDHAAWHRGGPLAAPRLSTKPPRQAAGRWQEWFSCGISWFSLFVFLLTTISEFSLCSLAPRRAPGSPQSFHKTFTRGGRAVARLVFMWLFVVFRRFSFRNHDFGNFISQPGTSEAPWQPSGFPQNRPGRCPGGGGNGFHVVIRRFSLFFA